MFCSRKDQSHNRQTVAPRTFANDIELDDARLDEHPNLLHQGIKRFGAEGPSEGWDDTKRAVVVAALGHAKISRVAGGQSLAPPLRAKWYRRRTDRNVRGSGGGVLPVRPRDCEERPNLGGKTRIVLKPHHRIHLWESRG